MSLYKIFLLAITLTVSYNNTFSMDQMLSHHGQAIVAAQSPLPLISFYCVSNRSALFQQPIPQDKGLFAYPKLLTSFIFQEPYCLSWYNDRFEKIFEMNKSILKTKNINPESLQCYTYRLAAEQLLMKSSVEFMCHINRQSIFPTYFIPQFHPVHNNQELKQALFFNEKGFYSYPDPKNFLVDTNLLQHVYRNTLKINLVHAHEIGLPEQHIKAHSHEIFSTLNCYQYDITFAQQGNR